MSRLLRLPALVLIGVLIVLFGGDMGMLAFLVFMGGALAYLGDQLGIYWGKKRISIMGMRPKNTAMFISVITGLLITLLTLIVASYLNENFQIALFRTNQLLEQQASLLAKQEELRQQGEVLQSRNTALQSEKENLEGVRALLLGEKGELERKVAEVEESLLSLQDDKRKKIAEIERLSGVVEKKETGLVVIHKGQPLLDTPVLVRLDAGRDDVEKVVTRLLADLRQTVQSLGLTIDPVAFQTVEGQLPSSVMEKLAAIRAACAERNLTVTECCIQPVSPRNVSIEESLQALKFDVKPNLLVFRTREEVARTSVDGRLSEEAILEQLFYFDKQVLSVLREKGVSSTSLRIRTSKISARQLVNFYKIVQLVRGLGRTVMVRFVALAPIYSYGEIDATYTVEDVPDPWNPEGRELGRTPMAATVSVTSPAATAATLVVSEPLTMPASGAAATVIVTSEVVLPPLSPSVVEERFRASGADPGS